MSRHVTANTLVAGLMLLAAGTLHAHERRLLEPETFLLDGQPLIRRPTFDEAAQGWYAIETNCRNFGGDGRGHSVAIHDEATARALTGRLDPPLPPGTYKIFVSAAGMAWRDRPTVLSVRLGTAAADASWEKGASRLTWVAAGQIEVREPAATITLEAVQWGGKGFAKLYDIDSRCILVDQVYLTSDPAETTGPTVAAAAVAHGDREAPAAPIVAAATAFRPVVDGPASIVAIEPACHPIRLVPHDGRRNLLPNGSFELGGGDGWAAANDSQAQACHIFGAADHVRDACHGEYALRLPGKGVRGMQFSRVFELVEGGPHTLSGRVKPLPDAGPKAGTVTVRMTPIGVGNRFEEADPKAVNKRPVLEAKLKLEGDWQQFVVSGPLGPGPYVLAVNGGCLLDAVQLERGEEATEFEPRAVIEASLTTDRMAHIFPDDEPTELVAWAHNSGTTDAEAALAYRIVDVRERVIEEKTLRFPVPAGRTVSQRVVVEPTRRGLFNVVYAAAGRPFADGELVYAVLPPVPAGMPRHALAANMDTDPVTFELMKRMGHKWQLYCKLYTDRPDKLEPQPGDSRWDALRQSIDLAREHGLEVMPALWPDHLPPHLQDPELTAWAAYGNGRRDLTRRVKQMAGKPEAKRTAVHFPDLAAWQEHCRRLATAIGSRQPWWTVQDETELYYSPREFARIVRATADGFRESGVPMKVSLSCMPDFLDEMIAELGGDVPLGGFGASSYDYEYWEARKARQLQERYDLPWFCIGVGATGGPQFRRTGAFGKPVYADAVRTAQHMVLLSIVQDAKVLGHYTGRLSWRGSLAHADFPLMDYDGTPLPHGFAYSCIPLLVPDAVPVEDVRLDALGTLVFVFRQQGRLHAVTWSNAVAGLDWHWTAEPRVWRDVRLARASGKVAVNDMFGNRRDDVRTDGAPDGGDLVFDLDEEPVFLMNEGLADADFLALVRGITAAPRPVEMRLAFIPDGKGGVDLGVHATNTTAAPLAGLALDANFPPNRMQSRVAWTIPSRTGRIEALPAGGTTWGRIPTTIDLSMPVENAGYTAWLTEADGREHAVVDTCWLTVAPRVAATAAGTVADWTGVPEAWMYYTFAWDRFGRHFVQFQDGGEHFKYVRRTDARASIRAGHDDEKLHLTIRCDDDDLVRRGDGTAGDRLEIHLTPEAGAARAAHVVVLEPTADGLAVTGSLAEQVTATLAVTETPDPVAAYTTWTVDVAIPLESLGAAGRSGEAIGFDVVWSDADRDGAETTTGTWRWAGRSSGLGSLFFTD
jgi:hypothetical protein